MQCALCGVAIDVCELCAACAKDNEPFYQTDYPDSSGRPYESASGQSI